MINPLIGIVSIRLRIKIETDAIRQQSLSAAQGWAFSLFELRLFRLV